MYTQIANTTLEPGDSQTPQLLVQDTQDEQVSISLGVSVDLVLYEVD